MVRRFIGDGHRVSAADIDTHAGAELAEQTGCHYIETNVYEPTANQSAVAEVVARFGGPDTICLNAGAPIRRTLGDDFDAEQYRRGMSVNLDGVVYGANAALPRLRPGRGAVLTTTSLAGITASPNLHYATSKHALIGLARTRCCCSPTPSPSTSCAQDSSAPAWSHRTATPSPDMDS